jgi:hypothetical protein
MDVAIKIASPLTHGSQAETKMFFITNLQIPYWNHTES